MMTPQEIVHELDKHIVGQDKAKRAVAVALRNRWRRQQVAEPLRAEITPKNILMIGPTGVGKTEIARRLARLADAPFIKVEATKFTEVGYVGRDVDTIMRDLVDIAVKQTREAETRKVRSRAADDRRGPHPRRAAAAGARRRLRRAAQRPGHATRQKFRKKLREGELDDKEIEIEVAQAAPAQWRSWRRPAWRSSRSRSRACSQNLGGARKRKTRKLRIREAMQQLTEEEAARSSSTTRSSRAGRWPTSSRTASCSSTRSTRSRARSEMQGAEVSRQGVQRDLLPLVEGTTVITKYGMIKHRPHPVHRAAARSTCPSLRDLIPELQGRFPIRVELASLTVEDFERILTSTDACLTRAVPGAARDRRRDAGVHAPTAIRRLARDRVVGQREDREHRRAAPVHRDGKPARAGRRSTPARARTTGCSSTPPMSTTASRVWRATRISRVTSSSPRHARAAGVLLRGAALG